MLPRFLLLPALATLVVLATPAEAQQIYKWKDASGVTHYSEQPPARGNYTSHAGEKDPAAAAAPNAAPATATAKADPRCDTARNNLATLNGNAAVQIDSDGDGKPDKTLSDAERQSQANLARSTLEAYNCTETGETAG